MRRSLGETMGTVSIVLPTAISSVAVKASLLMTFRSSRMLTKMIMISALVCSSQPMTRSLALFPFQDLAGNVNAGELAGNGGHEQQRRRAEDGISAYAPIGAQPRQQEEDRHHCEQDVMAELVHLFLVEHVGIENCAGQECADHEMQASPVGDEAAGGEPDQADIPAVTLGDGAHELANEDGGNAEQQQEAGLAANPLPVEQDQREHAPDHDVVEARVAQDALAERLAKDLQLFHQQHEDRQRGHGAGHADAENELPGPVVRADPALAMESMAKAATQPKRNGIRSARPAVTTVSERYFQT